MPSTRSPQVLLTLARHWHRRNMHPSTVTIRSSIAPGAQHPPSAENLAGLNQKKRRPRPSMCCSASAPFLRRLKGLRDNYEAMADAGAVVASFCLLYTHHHHELNQIWLFLVDHNFQAFRENFPVDFTSGSTIHHLKERVIEEIADVLPRTRSSQLTVWRCVDPTTPFDYEDPENLRRQLPNQPGTSRIPTAVRCVLIQAVAFTSNEVGDPITSQVVREYEHCFLRAHSQGGFTEEDIGLNKIVNADDGDAPEFVKKYKQMLGRKRKVADNIRGAAEMVVGGEKYFDYSTANVSALVVKEEVFHLGHISSSYRTKHWGTRKNRKTRLFDECDANWLLFYTIANHIDSHPSSIATDGTIRLSAKLGQESWPFSFVIKVGEVYHTYRPKSDFLALKFDLPRMAVEVNSTSPGQSAVDQHLMIQGASIVRFANTTLDTYKNEKNFVFVAIYISGNGQADRYVLYQRKGSDEVCRDLQIFVFADRGDRVAFALELYNLCSALADESDNGDTETEVKNLAASVEKFRSDYCLPTFTSKTKRTANDDGENQPGRNVRQK
ncbi:hypothetical protein EDB85DRAFT_2270263 [Lactarius pseudohatsudake]|nr:hypothetical protein EDB85DRAFT_2270263 [Lactarius pseudohatsudake]